MSLNQQSHLEAQRDNPSDGSEQLSLDDFEDGKKAIVDRTREALDNSHERPRILFVNGQAGAGKSYFSKQLCRDLQLHGVKAIFLETDMYHEEQGVEVYTHADFFRQKKAWEERKDFDYYNTDTAQKEMVNGENLDVIIIGGINATEELDLEPYSEVFISSPFINRLANKAYRDHIANTKGEVDIERFMDEIANPPVGQDYLAHALKQEIAGDAVKRRQSDICITNLHDDQAKFWIEGDALRFRAIHEGQIIESQRKLSDERMQLFEQILGIGSTQHADEMAKAREAIRRGQDGYEMEAIRQKLGNKNA